MALTIDEIREAALSGKSFTLTDIKLIDMSYDNGELSLRWEMPQMQNKHYCPGMVVDYISICEKPKHDPCRLFKAGDTARVVERFGRKDVRYTLGELVTVLEDECGTTFVRVKTEDGESELIAWWHLELVTPVEELESFGVRYSTDRDCAEVYHRRHKNTVAVFYRKCGITREQAEAHAEAERDRLNAECRKEQE